MSSKPILFSAPMVRALLAGTKTQTRRAVKPQPFWVNLGDGQPNPMPKCPYGAPGDTLWVKETWRTEKVLANVGNYWCAEVVTYTADQTRAMVPVLHVGIQWTRPKAAATGNVSPLFMPRWASRITLEVTSVRVERLHEISEADAVAEGIERHDGYWHDYVTGGAFASPGDSYRSLWESINGPRSWALNPWVWVVEFKRVKP